MFGFLQSSQFSPVIPAIGGFIQTIPDRNGVPHITFTSTCKNHFWIFRIDGQCTNALAVTVKNGFKGRTGIGGFPDATTGCTYIDGLAILGHPFNGSDPSAHSAWSEPAGFHHTKSAAVDGGLGKPCCSHKQG